MQAAVYPDLISAEDYLAGERTGEIRHEFVAGALYAMAGASEEHNLIAGNLHAALHVHLRGKDCRVYIVDFKVRLQMGGEEFFYYPDIMVACDPRDTHRYFKRYPKVLIEVLSEETARIDRREKFMGYTQIESLEEYVLIAQDKKEATVFRRSDNWRPEVLREAEQCLRLPSIQFSIALRAIYEGLQL